MNEYKKFAYYYDEVVSSLEYDLWLEFIEPYLKKDSHILDLACGTGTLVTMLKLKGYQAEGLDLSSQTIEIAREKAKINHLFIPFYEADMKNFFLPKKYDVITCFFDSVNFLKTKQDLDELFSCVKKHLAPKGYFILDMFSKAMLEEYDGHDLQEDYQTFKIHWRTKKTDEVTLKHTIQITEYETTLEETYFEYFHEIKSLNLEGFKLIQISGDFNDDLQPEDERILLVLQAL